MSVETPPAEAPIRIQLSRKKGWRMPENTQKVDRTTKWGNPFGGPNRGDRSKAEIVDLFRVANEHRPPSDFAELRGKNLACWCSLNDPCHADVLLELANRPEDAGA